MSLLQEYGEIQNRLEKVLYGKDKSALYADLVGLIIKISDYILESEEAVMKGVSEVMGGKVLELESERLLRIGKAEGMVEGEAKGKAEGKAEGMQQERIDAVQRMIRKGCTKEFILDLDYTEEEYAEAESGLCQMA